MPGTPGSATGENSPSPDSPPLSKTRRWRTSFLLLIGALTLAAGSYWGWESYQARREWRAAEEAARRRDLNSAATHLERYLTLRPSDPDGWFSAARTARRRGRFEDANRFLTECERLGGASDAIQLERDLVRVQRGELGTLDVRLRARIGPEHPEAVFVLEALARGYMTVERWPDARQACELWRAIQPDHPWPWLWSGWIAERLGEMNLAADCFNRALELDSEDWATRLSVARSLARRRDPTTAASHYEWVLARTPDENEALLGLAQCRIEQGRASEAIPLIDQVLKRTPSATQALSLRGKAAMIAGDFVGAETWLRQAIQADPSDAESLHLLVLSLRAQRKDAEAEPLGRQLDTLQRDLRRLTDLLRIIGTPRADANTYHEAGQIALRVGRTQQGVNLLEDALRQKGDHRATHAALAAYYRQAGKPELARVHQNLAEKP